MMNALAGWRLRALSGLRACLVIIVACVGFSADIAPRAEAQTAARFSAIDVTGNRRIEPETIKIYAGIETGTRVSPEDLNLAVRRLYATGLFSNVELQQQGGRLVIQVQENPSINRINFEGNSVLDDDELLAVINSRPRRAYTRGAAEADAQLVIEAYRLSGRYGAEVKPVIIEQSDNRVDLVFEVFEGEVTEVQAITFVGNSEISDRRLRRAIQTSEAGLLSFLFSSDNYDSDRLELDKQLLRRYYLERGYADFVVRSGTSELTKERDGFIITFAVSEGIRYRFGASDVVSSAVGLDPEAFRSLIESREGDFYDVRDVERTVAAMSFEAGSQGYAFIQVRPSVRKNAIDGTIEITYELVEGPKVYIERIDIRGNTSTLDRVIRRQFDVVEGDAFDTQAIQRAGDRIRGLNFFERSDVRVEQGTDEDRAVIVVDVEEKLTGSLAVGVGYSSSDGPVGSFILQERNFLGRGQKVGVEVTISGDRQAASFEFREPALFDRDLEAGFQIYYRVSDREDESNFDETNIGFEPEIEFPLSSDSRLTLRARISNDDITTFAAASPLIALDNGDRNTLSIGYKYVLDRRDSKLQPRSGYIAELGQDFGTIDGESYFIRSVAKAKAFASTLDGEVVFSAEVEGGALFGFGDDLRITDRFFLGGDSFRGFQFGGLGPYDAQTDDFLGGNLYAIARTQVTFPIGLPEEYGIYGGVFADAGTVWSLDRTTISGLGYSIDDSVNLRASVGVSLFWASGFGPIRVNFAYPIMSETGDEKELFRITAQTRF